MYFLIVKHYVMFVLVELDLSVLLVVQPLQCMYNLTVYFIALLRSHLTVTFLTTCINFKPRICIALLVVDYSA